MLGVTKCGVSMGYNPAAPLHAKTHTLEFNSVGHRIEHPWSLFNSLGGVLVAEGLHYLYSSVSFFFSPHISHFFPPHTSPLFDTAPQFENVSAHKTQLGAFILHIFNTHFLSDPYYVWSIR